MAGSTRYGFDRGAGDGAPPPSDDGGPRGARTVFGREIHLPSTPVAPVASPTTAAESARGRATTPLGGVVPTVIEAVPAQKPDGKVPSHHSGKTGFPSLARLFGRRNTQGEIVPITEPDLLAAAGIRPALGSQILLALAAAAVSFALVAAISMWTSRPARAPIASPAVPRPAPAPAPAPQPRAATAVAEDAVLQPSPPPSAAAPPPRPAEPAMMRRAPPRPVRKAAPAAPRVRSLDPDAPLPFSP